MKKLINCITKCFKKKEMKIDKSTFHHLSIIGEEVKKAILRFHASTEHFSEEQNNIEEAERVNCQVYLTYIVLKAVSFQDEYDKYFKQNNFPEKKIDVFKKCIKPVYQLISKEIQHLRTYRNYLYAHNYRDDLGNSIFNMPNLGMTNLKGPDTIFDHIKLCAAIDFLRLALSQSFQDDIDEFKDQIGKVLHDEKPQLDPLSETENLNLKLEEAFAKSNRNLSRSLKFEVPLQ